MGKIFHSVTGVLLFAVTNIPVYATAPSNDSAIIITLSEISGVWGMSQYSNASMELDALYIVINENGTFVTYDFAGDSYDQGKICYFNTSAEIIDLGNGNFKIGEEAVTIKTLAVVSCGDDEYFRYEKHGTPAIMGGLVGTWSANYDEGEPVNSNNSWFVIVREDTSTITLSPFHSETQSFCFKGLEDVFITDYGGGRFFFGEKAWMIYLYKGSLAFYG